MKRPKKSIQSAVLIVVIAAVALYQYIENPVSDTTRAYPSAQGSRLERGSRGWTSGEWILLTGEVVRVLGDDNQGSRHQRFIIELPESRTLLVAHNIDLADRVPVKTGGAVTLRGRYEPNDRGGVIHWTHHDPGGGPGGWIEYRGRRYQ